jgi:phosphoribosylformimino-5-aminoimidazole carboxamide ribonucleotide (ProFAR) isomerase
VVYQLGAENVIIAGSINSVDRVQRMHEIGPLGYTMGGALFEGAFKPGGSFRENLEALVNIDAAIYGGDR